MAEDAEGPVVRRGRREEDLDVAQPAHRVAFAGRLRELRRECGEPPYRALSRHAHCSAASLSAAAGGRRFPTWETTRGYVTGCLRHAGREAEAGRVLPRWRRLWEDADLQEEVLRTGPAPVPPAVQATEPRRRRTVVRAAAALVSVLTLLATLVAADASPRTPEPMAGLYNILVVPFDSLPALQRTVTRELTDWADADSAIETRVPDDDEHYESSLSRLAAAHGADIVLTGRLRTGGDQWTVVIEFLLTDRVFGETPEFVGRHEISITEPADVIRGNLELNQQLADDTVRYVKGVVSFVRGLGRYALDDYPGAEREFRVADQALTGTGASRAEVVLLMLGNAIGRENRFAEAAAVFRQALAQRPDYARASIGLAEALRAAGCERGGAGGAPLREAIGHYRSALSSPDGTLLEMKARLGLGLAHQCRSVVQAAGQWAEADAEFAAVLRLHAGGGLTAGAGRQSLRLAAEARAGQALTAYLTEGGPSAMATAAQGYEEAIGMLDRIGMTRPTIRERKLVFLRNLRDVYDAMNAPAEARAVDEQIRAAGGKR
ncbi:tetratricopeptide repeat protein [Actinoplanes sp. NBC_00393]|uniref:tetratricopeptide repeat protein n=1 Tax=Actinoplanes sp. NBC_00393 TaxID=2975953 RepID=UPI002E1D80A2